VEPTGNVPSPEVAEGGTRVNRNTTVKSKILSHFVKGKISLSPMEIVLMIPGELEHLESLVKLLSHRKKDAESANDQVSVASPVPTIRRICVNKTSRSKTLHLPVEINRCIVEGLVNTGASMYVMAAVVVWEMGMMHLVVGSETYKTTSRVMTHALGRIDEASVVVGGVQCTMIFMVVDTDSYDVLLGLDFLMKIGAIVDVERGLIQVKKGPGTNVEVLPLTVVNLLQNVSSEVVEENVAATLKNVSPGTLEVDLGKMSLCDSVVPEQTNMQMSESDTDTSDDSEEELQSVGPIEGESEFEDTELEELVLKEGPQQILQLTLQDQTNDFMREEISDSDDYANWIRWVSNAEEGKQTNREPARCAKVHALLQLHQVSGSDIRSKQLALSSDYPKASTRWEEIS
jgi:predicted aspartyl protease